MSPSFLVRESYQSVGTRISIGSRNAGAPLKARPWLPPLIWAGLIVFATSLPSSALPRQLGPFDKVAHFSMYAVLAALVTVAVRNHAFRKALVLIVLAVAAFGAVDEWHQRFIPGRSTEFADWVADSLGGLAGVITASLLLPRWFKRARA